MSLIVLNGAELPYLELDGSYVRKFTRAVSLFTTT
jgi:hypothetical protein